MKSFVLIMRFLLVLCMAMTASISLAIFKNDEPLAFNGNPLMGSQTDQRIAWNPVSGRLGLAFISSGPGVFNYAEWQNGKGIVLQETVPGSAVLGIAYDAKGQPRVGTVSSTNIFECVKAEGKWGSNDTKISSGLYANRGAYAFNPSTGTGAFLVNTKADGQQKQASYVYYQDGAWKSTKCGIGSYNETSIVFTAAGTPYAVWGNDDTPELGAIQRMAGDVTPGAVNVKDITGSDVNQYLPQGKIAVDPAKNEVWVVYAGADWGIYCRKWTDAGWSAPETIEAGSGGIRGIQLGFGISPSHDKAVLYSVVMPDGSTGVNIAYKDHTKSSWAKEILDTKGEAIALDLAYDSAGNLYGLYGSAPSGQLHLLTDYTPPSPLYVKVKMNNQAEPCVIHVFAHLYGGLFSPQANIWQDGIHMDEVATGYPNNRENFLEGNDESPWIDITPLGLSPYGDDMVQFFAYQESNIGYSQYDPGLPSANFSVTFSNTPSDEGIIKSFTRSGSGSGMMVAIDNSRRAEMKDDAANSQWQNDVASALPPTPGKRPEKFPVLTMCAVDSRFFQQKTVDTEIDTLIKLGFNDIDRYDQAWYDAGFQYFSWGSNYRTAPYIIDGERANPDQALIADFVKQEAEKAKATGHADKITLWTLYDEPSANSLDYIEKSPVCQAKFREYLQKRGLKPQFFGVAAWDKLFPTADKKKAKLYYYTAMYRGQQLVDLFKAGTDALLEVMPDVATTANFSDEVETMGSMMASGVDQFALFEQGALRLGWTESWMPWTATLQLNGYMADFLRGAVGDHGTGKFGVYNCRGWGDKLFWDIAAKNISAVGHGAQQIFHYNWGPYYGMAVDTGSHKPVWYPALQISNYAIGGVEDYLVHAKVPKSKIAILYSHATDAWTLDESGPAFGQDYCGLWLILRHLGYPIDVIQEKDIAAGKLTKDKYTMVICNARHLLDSALPQLLSWTKAGGVLYLGPGSLSYNQFNEPLKFDEQAGISRKEMVYSEIPGAASTFGRLNDLMPVTYGNDKLEAISGYQKMKSTPAGAKVLATFADGSPAVFTKPLGKGLLEFIGFFPGLGYEKAGVLTRQERDRVDPNFPSQSSTDWPAAYRALFEILLKPANIKLPVSTSHYLVEADRLEAPATNPGSIIALANWTGKPVANLTISLPRNGMNGIPKTVINSIISQSTEKGMLTVTMDMKGPVDFLVVPKN